MLCLISANSLTLYTGRRTSSCIIYLTPCSPYSSCCQPSNVNSIHSVELIEKLESNESSDFFLFKILRAHILPLTNCAFNKSGDKFITGSYDRTCKVWNTISGDELLTLEGHRNVVYAIAFNNPYGDKIITGSFGTYENYAISPAIS